MANDGEQGLRILELENFDLVLLDLALPGQSGLELAAAESKSASRNCLSS